MIQGYKPLNKSTIKEVVDYLIEKQKSLITLEEFGEINAIDINISLEELKNNLGEVLTNKIVKISEGE